MANFFKAVSKAFNSNVKLGKPRLNSIGEIGSAMPGPGQLPGGGTLLDNGLSWQTLGISPSRDLNGNANIVPGSNSEYIAAGGLGPLWPVANALRGKNREAAMMAAGDPGTTAKGLFRGESPMDRATRKRKQKAEKEREAIRAARQSALYSRAAGVNGSVSTARSANASADTIAELQAEYDRAEAQRDAESMQTIQSLMFLIGAL